MTIDQLTRELRTVAPVDMNEWRQLRALQISDLSADDRLRLDAAIDAVFEAVNSF